MYTLYPMVPYKSKDKQQQKIAVRELQPSTSLCDIYQAYDDFFKSSALTEAPSLTLCPLVLPERHAAAIQAW